MQLIARGGGEAQAAFTEIYDRYAVRVRAYCYTVLKDSDKAGDIFQDTFIRFYNTASKEEKGGKPIGWLITIARNLCLNAKRDHKPKVSLNDIDLRADTDRRLEDEDNSRIIGQAMENLDDETREAVALRYFEDLPYETIAEILDITAARARYLVFNGKKKMKKSLQPYLKEF
jgi:RNA polymerase sigma-70 factor (ECF subfamily)